jgi:hypothetical protein
MAELDHLRPRRGDWVLFDVDLEVSGGDGGRVQKIFWNATQDFGEDVSSWGEAEFQ